ncbi:hypothetical protein [Candidatus Nitrospira allomarina]|uniref:Mechanosensitive ion channel protein MscS n=1 Tax=Candidatus Nitrospira allomarina TaxID=3020900 RepID=A0AA96GG39_9BACT|nr:hypothetical protein [Candidatus Nitrospira allomarina]WNM57086.1 hypothetical protein PP769_14020 [Candidatus Nitrospira allomarina]
MLPISTRGYSFYFIPMSSTKVINGSILIFLLLGLPPLGIALSGQALPHDLTLLAIPLQSGDPSLSWPIFGLLALLISATVAPFLWRYRKTRSHSPCKSTSAKEFPWWGWMAVGWTTFASILAWTRFSWFQEWQPYTFPLLWLGYIAVINALCFSRTGRCMITHQPAFLFKLFLLSAGFWWTFEYLNQYVQNWHYVGLVPTQPLLTYSWFTLSFSTVLPAVLGTYEYLSSFSWIRAPFENWRAISSVNESHNGWLMFSLGCFGLLMIGIWPTLLYSLLWVSPLLIMVGIQIIRRVPTLLSPLAKGNWSPVVLSALAALVCGGFWEMWNAHSLVHWEYSIPYVHALPMGEMPILGYAGYLPFGMECLTVAAFFLENPFRRVETYAETLAS